MNFAISLLLSLAGACYAAPVPDSTPLRLTSPVTHSDWTLAYDPAPVWGPEGVHQILDRAKECGWSRVYWRCFDSGKACYASKLLEPFDQGEEVNYWKDYGYTQIIERMAKIDYGSFDTFAEAMRYGHEIGLEVWAWLSINEDDHGYRWRSKFTREHPEFRWVRRDGRPYNSQLSFAFPQVRAYKLNLLREIIAYKPDGIFFDWIRTGDVRDNPHTEPTGVANYGYETPNLQSFQRKYGLDAHEVPNEDERWVAVRAEPQTIFMREARAIIRVALPNAQVCAMVQHPWSYRGARDDTIFADSRCGLLCDIGDWAREGLIDAAITAGYYRADGTPEKAYRWLVEETGGQIPVWYYGWNGASAENFKAQAAEAEKLGAEELLLWESDYIALPPANPEAVKAMKDYLQK